MSEEILAAFASESVEILEAIEESSRSFEAGGAEDLDGLFRNVHTLKGSAGIVGLARLESFAHEWESRLAKLRSGGGRSSESCGQAFLACRDQAAAILSAATPTVGSEAPAQSGKLLPVDLKVLRLLDEAILPSATMKQTPSDSRERLEALTEAAPARAVESPAGSTSSAEPVGQVGSGGQASISRNSGLEGSYSRVANAKLEAILAEATEIAQVVSELGREAAALGSNHLVETAGSLQSLAAKLYRSVLETRMVPFGDVAERYRRAVTEIARSARKSVRFVLVGADTEIDKALADRLAEPLLHLVRNAADHGIESSQDRLAAGKSEAGTVTLSARRDVGALVVRIEDDGRGVDPELIHGRALETGMLAPGASPSREELLRFLFAPGFSLSSKVTRWSGRGVGLDAVDRAVRALRGSSHLESKPGIGFVSEIRLPLALSLAEGFQAKAASVELLVPYEAVKACFEFYEEGRGAAFRSIPLNGRLFPAVDLSIIYGEAAGVHAEGISGGLSSGAAEGISEGREEQRETQPKRLRIAIIIAAEGSEACILVDEVGKTISAPVRPIDRRLADSPGVAGTAVLGDGSLVLVLDAPGIVRIASMGGF